VERTAERDLLPIAKTLDIAVITWGTLGDGVLTGKYNPGKERSSHSRGEWGDRSLTERNLAIAEAVESISQEIGYSPSQMALSWIRQQPYGVMPAKAGIQFTRYRIFWIPLRLCSGW
jgi:aryl-alcohol dehydrogenase-like predicted oxidoreductase